MISVNNISKYYGNKNEIIALEDINLDVKKGEIFGLIGPDGAGKTTLFRILTTLIIPDKGEASVEGYDVVKDFKSIRQIAGYMPGKFSLYQDLSVEENLNFFATIFNTTIAENYHLIKDIYVQLEPFKKRRAGDLSGGMKQKLALCCALIHKPEVLFLDEPTTGVDVVSRKEFWQMLKNLKSQGITIFVSTPYMDEAEQCERIALIQNGKILSVNSTQGIIDDYHGILYGVKAASMNSVKHDLSRMEHIMDVYTAGEYLHVKQKDLYYSPNDLAKYLENKGHINVEVIEKTPNIEDCFLNLMQIQS
jgi:ABC-type multidrug transport system ATPase subunit